MLGGIVGATRLRAVKNPDGRLDRQADSQIDGHADVERATEAAWWTLRWHGWASWSLTPGLIALSAFVVALDVVSAWANLALGHLGRISVSPALPFAIVVACWIGLPALGVSRRGWTRWREYGAAMLVFLVTGVVLCATELGSGVEAGGFVVAALGEELVYRLAALVVVGALVAALAGRDWRNPQGWGTGPGVIALLAGAVVFSLLPGHLEQAPDLVAIVPFVSFAVVLGWVVLRTGALWPAAGAHAVLNLMTIGTLGSSVAVALRLGISGVTLVGLLVAADLAGRRAGRLRAVPSVVDLTAVSS